MVQAPIKVNVVHARLSFLKQSSVAVAGRLVVFVYVRLLGGAHFVSGQKINFMFLITWVVAFFNGFF